MCVCERERGVGVGVLWCGVGGAVDEFKITKMARGLLFWKGQKKWRIL